MLHLYSRIQLVKMFVLQCDKLILELSVFGCDIRVETETLLQVHLSRTTDMSLRTSQCH